MADFINRPLVDESYYRAVLGGMYIPKSIIATSPDRAGVRIFTGGDRSLLHDLWVVCTDDRQVVRASQQYVSHSAVVDVGGSRLSNSENLTDSLTSKILCHGLLTARVNKRLSARAILSTASNFSWFIRWRNSLGIKKNSILLPEHFDDFVRCLYLNGVHGLVPLAKRIADLEKTFSLDHRHQGVDSDRRFWREDISWATIAAELGVNPGTLMRCPGRLLTPLLHVTGLSSSRRSSLDLKRRQDRAADDRPRSLSTVLAQLLIWGQLYDFSRRGMIPHDPISFDPFAERSVATVAGQISRPKGRTATLAPWDLFRLMDAAARWVMDFSAHVLAAVARTQSLQAAKERKKGPDLLRESEAFDNSLPPSMPRIFLSWRVHSQKTKLASFGDRISTRMAVKYLLTASAILVGTFAMRRDGEVRSLRAGCVEEPLPGLCALSIYIEKTLRSVDCVPVPKLVQTAVRVLEELTQATRSATGEDWLFHYDRQPGTGRQTNVLLDKGEYLNEFAIANGLAPPKGQTAWNLASHQLRRGGAILYYHCYPVGSLDALSWMMRHYDPNMTRIYIHEVLPGAMAQLRQEIHARIQIARNAMTEEDRSWLSSTRALLDELVERVEIYNAARCEAHVHKMLQMLDGEITSIGQGAARLRRDLSEMVDEARANVRIGSRMNNLAAERETLLPLLHAHARLNHLEPVPGGVAHCLCRPGNGDDLAAAECAKLADIQRTPWAADKPQADRMLPPVEFSGTYVCLKCTHCAVFPEGRDGIEADRQRLALSARLGATPAARAEASGLYEELVAATEAAVEAAQAV